MRIWLRLSLVLAIEISNPSSWTPASKALPGVAVGRVSGGAAILIAHAPINPVQTHDDTLLPAISGLFERHALATKDIARIAVSVGPGGFTAIRIAVTAAKFIAETTHAQCVSVASAAVAYAFEDPQPGQTLVLLAAKGETFHCTRYSADRQLIDSPAIVSASDVDLHGVSLVIADRFVPESLRVRAASLGINMHEPNFDPCRLLAIQHEFPGCDPLQLAPIYPREPEAVTKWRELKRQGRK